MRHAGMARRAQVMSRPRLMSRFLVRQGICRPSVSRSLIKPKPVRRPCLTAIRRSALRWARSRTKGGSPAAHRPAPAHPQVRLPPAASAGLGSRHWPRWRRCSGRCRRSRPEAITRCPSCGLVDRALQRLVVIDQDVARIVVADPGAHPVLEVGLKALHIQLSQQHPPLRRRTRMAGSGSE